MSVRLAFTGRTTRNRRDPGTWRVDRCVDCGLRFLNPQPTWAELREYYPDDYAAYDGSVDDLGRTEDEVEEVALARGGFRHVRVSPGMRLLDVGCGAGFFLRIARRLGAIVEGVEPSSVGAARASATGLSVFNGNLEQYVAAGQRRGAFDLITANHVLEHVPDPVGDLRRMRGMLAPNGTIWIAVPNGRCVFARLLRDRWHSTDLPLHLMHFDRKSLAEMARRAGVHVERMRSESLERAVLSSLRQLLHDRIGIPGSVTALTNPILRRVARVLGRALDRRVAGEALIAELSHRSDTQSAV
jgi:2-polyprenyl-3-methyl-5-hydroxy-6-metoxy-1,4-benzoquinol methylase